MFFSLTVTTTNHSNIFHRVLLILTRKQIIVENINICNVKSYKLITLVIYCISDINLLIKQIEKQIDVVNVNYYSVIPNINEITR